jgi:hypothetical protein
MQNKPNFGNKPMSISPVMTKHYDNFRLLGRRKNKPNSNPIQNQNKPNQTQFQTRLASNSVNKQGKRYSAKNSL